MLDTAQTSTIPSTTASDSNLHKRSYFDVRAAAIASTPRDQILGALTARLPFAVDPMQRDAWLAEIDHIKGIANELDDAHIFFEFMIPRMGRRADVVILYHGLVFVLEYKVGGSTYDRHALDQVYGYGLDLKHFHETSHVLRIIPVLVATDAPAATSTGIDWDADGLCKPLKANRATLCELVRRVGEECSGEALDPIAWEAGRYKPTPTIIEAAQALYRGHDVKEISRSEAGAENLSRTADFIADIIEGAKARGEKAICIVSGVPGSGKTLAGLNIANSRMRAHDDEHAVFLSGNGPLVEVLREALAIDAHAQATANGQRTSRGEEKRKAAAFIQNIHHFRDEALLSDLPPVGKVVVFDEAQRAWSEAQTSKFMREKRGRADFSLSEPEFLLSVMDRHPDWCAVICLVGEGQEINTGEAGLQEWLAALRRSFPHWYVYHSDKFDGPIDAQIGDIENATPAPELHLSTSIRSFRAEKLSEFVAALVAGSAGEARNLFQYLENYPIHVTRSLSTARRWLRSHRRGPERSGLLASSNALRLKPEGIFVKAKVDPPQWFLAPVHDVRSSDALEDAASEFEVQGLELDWSCVCWDANWRFGPQGWQTLAFRGTAWQRVSDPMRQMYIANSYRVLLTRARQGMVIFVPQGDDHDPTRQPSFYDATFNYLRQCGISELDDKGHEQP